MADSPKVLLTSVSLVPAHGGLPKTVKKFGEALGADIASFTSSYLSASEVHAFPEVRHVMTGGHRLLDWYAWADADSRNEIESIAAEADLLSCHVMLRYHANWVRKMAKENKIPYWFVPHGQLDPWVFTYRAGIKKLWLWLFGRRLLRDAAHIIFSTEQEREKAKWFYDGPNTRVVHWPVDLIDLSEKERARSELRQKLGAEGDTPVILYLGRMHPMKRPLETVEAFCAAASPEAHLVLIGPEEGVTVNDCQSIAESAGMVDRVHALGPVYGAEKEAYLLGADAYISLSQRENFNHTAAEALAAGIPVILSPGNDLAPELKPYDCGWFLDDVSTETVRTALQACMEATPLDRKAMGLRGRDFIATECSFEGFQQALQALRDQALE